MGEKPSRHMTAAGPSKHLERANSLRHYASEDSDGDSWLNWRARLDECFFSREFEDLLA